MAITISLDLKRKGASPPVSSQNLSLYTGQLALCRLKQRQPDANAFRLMESRSQQTIQSTDTVPGSHSASTIVMVATGTFILRIMKSMRMLHLS